MSSNSEERERKQVPLEPTWQGHVSSTVDAVLLFEACLSGTYQHVPRRPHDRERPDLIQSGHIFIYEEHASGIKRWTDGVTWSPSRILGNYLIYRELDKPFPPGEKKRANRGKRASTSRPSTGGIIKSEPNNSAVLTNCSSGTTPPGADSANNISDAERALIGSLVDSYPFKEGGLIKKTISITYRGVPHHLVSYYTVEDVLNGRLQRPSHTMPLNQLCPRAELILSQNFRAPIDEVDPQDARNGQQHPLMAAHYGLQSNMNQAAWPPRSMSTPGPYTGLENGRQWPVMSYIPQVQQQAQSHHQQTQQQLSHLHHPQQSPPPAQQQQQHSPAQHLFSPAYANGIPQPMGGIGFPPSQGAGPYMMEPSAAAAAAYENSRRHSTAYIPDHNAFIANDWNFTGLSQGHNHFMDNEEDEQGHDPWPASHNTMG